MDRNGQEGLKRKWNNGEPVQMDLKTLSHGSNLTSR
jgi:hypothetical protein